MMQPPAAAPIVKRKALPDTDASSSAATSRAAVHDDDAIAGHENVVYGTTPYSPPMSPTLSNRSSMPLTVFDARHSMTPTAVYAHLAAPLAVVDANAITTNAERSQLARASSSATAATMNGPPPSYSRYEDSIQPISADQLAMLPPAPPGMVYLIASSNGQEKIMTR
jgi:hypothetical protein